MRNCIYFILLIGFALMQSCNSESGGLTINSENEGREEDSLAIDSLDTVVVDVEHFNSENFQIYTDSILEYFDFRNQRDSGSSNWTCDTSVLEGYVNYDLKVFRKGHRRRLIQIEIFEFENKELASDYFNDLKSQEYLFPFGLNKRPNHILVDSNRVFWHHMEHLYGHRMDDLNAIFAETFSFYPKSTNLDSVSGFTYCQCKNEFASTKSIQGKWVFDQPIEIRDSSNRFTHRPNGCEFELKAGSEMSILTDSIVIDSDSVSLDLNSAMELPNNKYYWQYQYFGGPQLGHNGGGHQLSREGFKPEFVKKTDQLIKIEVPVKRYSIRADKSCYIEIVTIEGYGTYCEFGNKLSKIRRK